jgi:hypothetical protein
MKIISILFLLLSFLYSEQLFYTEAQSKKVIQIIDQQIESKHLRDFTKLFATSSFEQIIVDEEVIPRIAFKVFDILDSINYKNKLKDSYSNWFLTQMQKMIAEKPKEYLIKFFIYAKYSDGWYAEWFIDKSKQYFQKYPHLIYGYHETINLYQFFCSYIGYFGLKSMPVEFKNVLQKKNSFMFQNLQKCQ